MNSPKKLYIKLVRRAESEQEFPEEIYTKRFHRMRGAVDLDDYGEVCPKRPDPAFDKWLARSPHAYDASPHRSRWAVFERTWASVSWNQFHKIAADEY